jgi:hypothetical protein
MLNYENYIQEQKKYKPGISRDFWNAPNWFSMGRIVIYRKWIKMINYIFHDVLYNKRGVVVNEVDPYGEENWDDDNDIQNDQELKDIICNFFEEFLPNTSTPERNMRNIIEEIQENKYKIENIVRLLKIIKIYLQYFSPKEMSFYKLGSNNTPWIFHIVKSNTVKLKK